MVTTTVNNHFITQLLKRFNRTMRVALRQHITVSFDQSTVSNYLPHDLSVCNESEFTSASTIASVKHLSLAKGWYMLEVTGNGRTIGSNLSVGYKADESKLSDNLSLKSPLVFNLSLIHISEPTRQEASRMPSSA